MYRTGIVDTAHQNMTRDYQPIDPFAPAGMTDMTRTGFMAGLQGHGGLYNAGQQYSGNMDQRVGDFRNQYNNWMSGGMFSGNPNMDRAVDTAGRAPNDPFFGQAAHMGNRTMDQYGGGWSGSMANQINQTGASFDPFNNPALGQSISAANQRLGRDFNQSVMPELNRAAVSAGPGAYGGTRAGVAQGIREQGLADAMQKQTTDMSSQGYAEGLNRYVQDRGQTLGATNRAMEFGGNLGMQNAGLMAELANSRAGHANTAAQTIGDMGKFSLNQRNDMWRFGQDRQTDNIRQQWEANRAPGLAGVDMGNAMQDFGNRQQTDNQATLDWMNRRANHANNYQDERLQKYSNLVNPYLEPGKVAPQQVGQPANTYGDVAGGALAGYGAYDAWNRSRNPGAWQGPPAGTNPSAGQAIPGPVGQTSGQTSSFTYGLPPQQQTGPFGY